MPITKLFTIFLLLPTLLLAEISQSILPTIEYVESLQIDRSKVTPTMWTRMENARDLREIKLRVMSYNMLYTIYEQQHPKIHHWLNRKERVLDLIQHVKADLICPQELLQPQLNYLTNEMDGEYAFFGYRSSDGIAYCDRESADPDIDSHEVNGFFYKKTRLKLRTQNVWWLSETPEKPSSSPYSSVHRTLTMGCFQDTLTGHEFYAFNCHLAFQSAQSREFEATLISQIIALYSDKAVILTGDLNTFPMRPDLEGLPFFDGDHILRILSQASLTDSYQKALLGHVGPIASFTNTTVEDARPFRGTGVPGVLLDHILVSDRVTVLIHAVEPALSDGHFPSDHMPVLVDIAL